MSSVRGLDTEAAEHVSRTDGRDLQPSVLHAQVRQLRERRAPGRDGDAVGRRLHRPAHSAASRRPPDRPLTTKRSSFGTASSQRWRVIRCGRSVREARAADTRLWAQSGDRERKHDGVLESYDAPSTRRSRTPSTTGSAGLIGHPQQRSSGIHVVGPPGRDDQTYVVAGYSQPHPTRIARGVRRADPRRRG
jgi:hypothetical protein